MKTLLSLLFVFTLNFGVATVWAADPPPPVDKPVVTDDKGRSSGAQSVKLAQGMYCSVHKLLEGDIGLAIGLILAFVAVWTMVQGGSLSAAAPPLIMGALITALPRLVESGLVGLGNLLKDAGITQNVFTPPDCSSVSNDKSELSAEEVAERHKNPQPAVFYPGRGSFTQPKGTTENTPGKAEDDEI